MQEILKATDIFKSYRLGHSRIEVLKGLNLSVAEGEFLAVVGASGSGKSTMLDRKSTRLNSSHYS